MSMIFMNSENNTTIEQCFNVIGISIRTTNQEAIEKGTIQQLWQQFVSQSIAAQIPHSIDHTIIALYYNFENDKNGQYDVLLGMRVSSIIEVPTGMTFYTVPTQKTRVFVSSVGPVSEVCFGLWQDIWRIEDQGKLNRLYQADYEIYDARSSDPQNAQVAIHIGIK